MLDEPITLHLTRAEALVLFEWLALCDTVEDRLPGGEAEQVVRWRLEGELEKLLTEPLARNYKQLLEEARRIVVSAS